MNFSEQLNEYMLQIDCSAKELSNISGLSPTVISRYRNGERTPSIRSTQLNSLVEGLYELAITKKANLSKEEIHKSFSTILNDVHIDLDQLVKNFNELVSVFNINIAELSRKIGYNSSYLSKIRTGNIYPTKPQIFIDDVSNFIVNKYNSEDDKKAISLLINCNVEKLSNPSNYYENLRNWFSTNTSPSHNYINDFLNNLDTFDLNEYIKAIHFDEMKVPFVPFYKSGSRNYYGIEEMKKGELDFFKATVLSKSNEPVFMCSDMPMEDMAKDLDFGKKWMFAIAMTLKKGLHLNIIHNIDRPFNEMMLGLESWIPIYMTGQVSPYYLSGFKDNVYSHINYTSGLVALTGECINGHHDKGKYYLTSSKTEVEYYKTKSELLLNKAKPLMEIYKVENKNAFNAFLSSSSKTSGNRRRILSSLPIHTISDELLLKILKHNKISEEDTKNIVSAVKTQKELIENVLQNNMYEDEIHEITKEDFEKNIPALSLSDSFYEGKIYYTYEEYLEHLKQTKKYEKCVDNYRLNTNYNHTFKNIQVLICEKNWVMISKDTSPSIHFVIHHPKLRDAIENFIPPVVE